MDEQPGTPRVSGAPSTPEYVAAQPGDLPDGLMKCGYSGAVPAYLASMMKLDVDAGSIAATWTELRALGGTDGYIAVFADTPRACTVWVTGSPEGPVHGSSRIVSTVVVAFADAATAEAAYDADIFKQSAITNETGLRVLSGPATGLSQRSVIGADEAANPTSHQAVWQNGAFNVFFNSRNLSRAEFEAAISAENGRIG